MCLTLQWLAQVLVWLIIVGAIVALLRLVVPWVLAKVEIDGGIILKAIWIVIYAIVAIFVVYFVFDLISCLAGHLPAFPKVR